MQAITTRYFGPTNTKGSRVKATAAAGSITVGWDDRLNHDRNHCLAAKKLALKFGWGYGTWHQGGLPNGDRVFVCPDRHAIDDCDQFTIVSEDAA